MVSASTGVGGEKTGKLTEMEEEALRALRERRDEGKNLSDIRCGAAVLERITGLESRGIVRVEGVEDEDGFWSLNLELVEETTSNQ